MHHVPLFLHSLQRPGRLFLSNLAHVTIKHGTALLQRQPTRFWEEKVVDEEFGEKNNAVDDVVPP